MAHHNSTAACGCGTNSGGIDAGRAPGAQADARGKVVAAAHGVWTIWPRDPDGKESR